MNEQERRRHVRVVLDRPGTIQLGNGPELSTYLTEISEGGARCLLSDAVSLGAKAELRFALPLAADKNCLVAGRVQHRHQEGDSYVLGVEFTRVPPDVAEAIRAFIQAREPVK